MIEKVFILCVACFAVAGCATDKVSMASEVGGSNTTPTSDPTSPPPASDPPGSSSSAPYGLEAGLGVTGGNGALANVLGDDVVGGVLDGALGQGNVISDLLGTDNGKGTGFVPAAAAAINGDGSDKIFGSGLGISEDGGLVDDLVGTDLAGMLLGYQGLVPASIAGGNDGLLGSLLADENANPALATVAQLLPISSLVAGYSNIPHLGVTGEGGVVTALLGNDLLGNAAGRAGILGGGADGVLASHLPEGNAPLAPVGQGISDVLSVVSGNTDSPLAPLGNVLAQGATVVQAGLNQALDGVPNVGGGGTPLGAIVPALAGLGSNLPTGNSDVLSNVLGGLKNPTPASLPVASTPALSALTTPISQVVSALPLVGGLIPK